MLNKCPESIEELDKLVELIPMCRKELFVQAKSKIESGIACSIAEASRQLGEETGKNPDSIDRSIRREQSNQGMTLSDLTETNKYTPKSIDKEIVRLANQIKKEKNKAYKAKEEKLNDTSDIVIDNIEDRYSIYNCDLLESPIEDNSLDAIVTDPPYPYEFIDCWSKLASFASAKLKDGGILVAMSGQSYLPEVYSNMNIEGLNYYWTCCLNMTVAPNLYQKRLQTQWKPLLFYVKGTYNRTHLKSDIFNSEYKDTLSAQKHHKWGQGLPLMKDIIERFTYADELICDPFVGGGTTILAGLELKRRMIGIDIDKEACETTLRRIQSVAK